ncbi:MAG: 4-hydroxythreonine-4-phosphate dehydrogenase PdxA [Muribaculaceae bacterium]|nr:4-hydroxythreonine-4-phosphate dehydrogenase PdxA [Muribaculaceae bacterium]
MTNERKIRVGITQGDTNGIGYEVILKTLSTPEFCELCTPVVYGSSKIMTFHRKAIEMPSFPVNNVRNGNFKEGAVNLVEVMGNEEVKVEMGQPDKQAGRAAFLALEAAVAALNNGDIDVLVTAPINKENIQSEHFTFPGHTEYLEACTGEGDKALMVLCNERLRVALVTTHLPIAQVPAAITPDAIMEKLRIFNQSLKRDYCIGKPRIAVLSLNPHSGENGLLGAEEKDVIIPTIKAAYEKERIMCFGPYAADGFFGNGMFNKFDGVLAMYHDQGLAAFKTLAMDDGVNFTAGLPVVRTSPDHGTGYDIAGKNLAHENSLRQAVYTAIDIYRNRLTWDESHANPLRKQYFERGKDNVVLDLTKDE